MKRHCFTLLTSLFLLLCVGGSGQAATTFDNLVVFGDSLSDTGQIGRFSDGDIWVETLARSLGLTLYNNAYAGATTGYDNPGVGLTNTGLLWQVDEYVSSLPSEYSLVTVWAGANDLANNRGYENAVANIATALGLLYEAGFRYFMVPNLPDIGNTPIAQATGETYVQAASLWSREFNAYLAAMLTDFAEQNQGAVLYDLDIYAVFDEYTVNAEDWEKLFWTDGYHPSSVGHNLIASVATNAVPVPQTAILLISGLFGLVLAGCKRQKKYYLQQNSFYKK
ncbi:MAG: SGNH/GDSL hydrolase family protein [Desulfobacterales bacterium]|nr:SGNH/GDSL hydrolase family protein [Desulfobacterales bacterium]